MTRLARHDCVAEFARLSSAVRRFVFAIAGVNLAPPVARASRRALAPAKGQQPA